MEGVCGVFQSTLVAPWVSGVGTLIAATTALFIYWRNRRNQVRDLQARRKVLESMLVQHLAAALSESLVTYESFNEQTNDALFVRCISFARRADVERLVGLQKQLVDLAGRGDVELAAFIECYRTFDRIAADLESKRKVIDDSSDESDEGMKDFRKDIFKHGCSIARDALRDLYRRAIRVGQHYNPDFKPKPATESADGAAH
jgi:hypothetical protein